jgi:hypothetical protein
MTMNDDNKVQLLSLGMYGILFNNKWRMTLELFDGTKVNGRLKNHNTQSSPYHVTVTLITEDGEEKTFDLKNVKDITG